MLGFFYSRTYCFDIVRSLFTVHRLCGWLFRSLLHHHHCWCSRCRHRRAWNLSCIFELQLKWFFPSIFDVWYIKKWSFVSNGGIESHRVKWAINLTLFEFKFAKSLGDSIFNCNINHKIRTKYYLNGECGFISLSFFGLVWCFFFSSVSWDLARRICMHCVRQLWNALSNAVVSIGLSSHRICRSSIVKCIRIDIVVGICTRFIVLNVIN